MFKTIEKAKAKGQFLWLDYSEKDVWRNWLSKLLPEKRDIYYEPDYVRLYAADDNSANCYIYVSGNNIYLYPFIRQAVPKHTGYFDITTAYGYGGPISNTEDPVFLNEAYQTFYREALGRKIIAEVIKFHPLLNNHLLLADIFRGDIIRMRSTVYVEMDIDEDYRWRCIYTHANRKNINKARRNNIETRTGQDNDLWQAFELLYEATVKNKNLDGFYFFTPEYFRRIRKNLTDNYILVACAYNNKIISVMLVLLDEIYAHCHLIGTDANFQSTGVNNLLYHELIQWCNRRGYQKLHMGGGRSNSDVDSLLRFKRNFSDKKAPFYVGESVFNSDVYDKLCTNWGLKNPDRQVSNCLLKYRLV